MHRGVCRTWTFIPRHRRKFMHSSVSTACQRRTRSSVQMTVESQQKSRASPDITSSNPGAKPLTSSPALVTPHAISCVPHASLCGPTSDVVSNPVAQITRASTRECTSFAINDDTLEELWFVDPARVHPTLSSDEPSWVEIKDELTGSDPLLPRVNYSHHYKTPTYAVPTPRTPKRLCENLVRLLNMSPPVPLPGLINYHTAYVRLQSTRSYNYLIALAIRHASFGTAQYLFRRMAVRGIGDDLETRKLRVRLMVRMGYWTQAWTREVSSPHGSNSIPLSVWLEFLGTDKRGWDRPNVIPTVESIPGAEEAHRTQGSINVPPSPLSRKEQLRLVLSNLPYPTPKEWADTPPRVMRHIVKALLHVQANGEAMSLTKLYFSSLPTHINDKKCQECLEIIHLHVTSGSKRGLTEFYRARKALYKLLDMHPKFAPNSTTLFHLLGRLREVTRCGVIAHPTVKAFQLRWGNEIVDQRVQRCLAALATKEGRLDLAIPIVETEQLREALQRSWRTEQDVVGGSKVLRHRILFRRRHRLVFPRPHLENWKWRMLRRRVRRRFSRMEEKVNQSHIS